MTQTNDGGATDLTTDDLKQPTCRKCGGTMRPGIATGQTVTAGMPDDLGGDVQTLSAGGPGAVIPCSKCVRCGWSVTAPDAAHPDDLAVNRFAYAMKIKLSRKRAEGRGGWNDKDRCSAEYLSQLLREHVAKGDPVDVANFAMMLHQRGEGIAGAAQTEAVPAAWILEYRGARMRVTTSRQDMVASCRNTGCNAVALYAHPAAPAPGIAEADIEIMARAMCESDMADFDAPSSQHTVAGQDPEDQREYWRDKAQAALRALKGGDA